MNKKDKIEQMAQAYRDGLTLKEIGKQFDISAQAVQRRIAAVGVTQKDRPPAFRLIDKTQLETIYAENLSLKRIAARIGTNVKTITDALRFYQIPKRKSIKKQGHRVNLLKKLEIGGKYEETFYNRLPHMRVYASAKRVGIKVSTRQIDRDKLEITRVE